MARILAVLACVLVSACAHTAPSRVAAALAVDPPAQTSRRITFNDRALTVSELRCLEELERAGGARLADGDYWYDARSGAAGSWGGPTSGYLRPGLTLGGPLPAGASGGGDGRLSGVFVNGREIPPEDHRALVQMLGRPVQPGRYFIDSDGNAGPEGGAAVTNVFQLARLRRASGYRIDASAPGLFAAPGCATARGRMPGCE